MLRISWTEHRTNESVLNEIGIDRELAAIVKKWKLQYFGHMIGAQNLCTHIFEGPLDGTRGRGRPRRRWGDDISTEAYKGHTKNTPIQLSKSKNFVFRNLNISFLEIEKFCFSKSNNFVCQNLEISFFWNLNISFLEIYKFCFSKSNNFVCQNLEILFFEI